MRIVICLAVILGSFGCSVKTKKKTDEAVEAKKPTVEAGQPNKIVQVRKKWYQGGTLHEATMKDWSEATYENKLATAADFLTKSFIEDEGVEVLDVERTMRPVAAELVAGIDKIYEICLRERIPKTKETSAAEIATAFIDSAHDDFKAKLLRN